MQDAYIVSPLRSAVGKAIRGTLRNKRPDELAADIMKAVIADSKIDPSTIEDVIVGCAMPEAEQGMNVARFALLLAGLPESVPGLTVNRFCSSGVQTIAMAASQIKAGESDCILAGGTESMSMVPMMGNKVVSSRLVMDNNPDYYLGMGMTAENVADEYKITRTAQDEFALASHEKSLSAIDKGMFKDEIAPVEVTTRKLTKSGEVDISTNMFCVDEGPRAGSSLEALGRLRPVFKMNGSVTAANSSQMSDGAGFCLVCSGDYVKEHNLKPMAKLLSYRVAGVPPRIMGIGPAYAIPMALEKAGLKLADIGRIELNEAFASQSIAVIDSLKLNSEIVNPTGGAISMGHPLGATGAKLTASLLHGMRRDSQKYGIVTMCIGTGMGACAVFENLN